MAPNTSLQNAGSGSSPPPQPARSLTTAALAVTAAAAALTGYLRLQPGIYVSLPRLLPFGSVSWQDGFVNVSWVLLPYAVLAGLVWRARMRVSSARWAFAGAAVCAVPVAVFAVWLMRQTNVDADATAYCSLYYWTLAPIAQGIVALFTALLTGPSTDAALPGAEEEPDPVMARSGWGTLAVAAAGALAVAKMSAKGCDCTEAGVDGLNALVFGLLIAGPYVAAAALAVFLRRRSGASAALLGTFLVLSAPAILTAGFLALGPPVVDGQAGMGLGFVLIGASVLQWIGVPVATGAAWRFLPESVRTRRVLTSLLALLAALAVMVVGIPLYLAGH